MIKIEYVNWLVDWIRNEVVNPRTGRTFVIGDIKDKEYRLAVQNVLNEDS